jgi:hypothetical protein
VGGDVLTNLGPVEIADGTGHAADTNQSQLDHLEYPPVTNAQSLLNAGERILNGAFRVDSAAVALYNRRA